MDNFPGGEAKSVIQQVRHFSASVMEASVLGPYIVCEQSAEAGREWCGLAGQKQLVRAFAAYNFCQSARWAWDLGCLLLTWVFKRGSFSAQSAQIENKAGGVPPLPSLSFGFELKQVPGRGPVRCH